MFFDEKVFERGALYKKKSTVVVDSQVVHFSITPYEYTDSNFYAFLQNQLLFFFVFALVNDVVSVPIFICFVFCLCLQR